MKTKPTKTVSRRSPSKPSPARGVQKRLSAYMTPAILVLVFAVIGTMYLVMSSAAPSAGVTITSGFTNANGRMCLDDLHDRAVNATPIGINNCNNSAEQQWHIRSTGQLTINGYCMGVNTPGGTYRAVQLFGCRSAAYVGQSYQQWQADGAVLVNVRTGMCLTVRNAPSTSPAPGTGLTIDPCTNGQTNCNGLLANCAATDQSPIISQVWGFPQNGSGLPSATTKGIGLSVPTFPSLSQSQQVAWLQDFKTLGVTWMRIDIKWSKIQPTGPSTYDWSEYDAAINEANTYGIHVDGEIDYATPWATNPSTCPATANSRCQPSYPTLYATYAAAVVRHFGDKLGAVEIWNEPNNVTFWQPAPNPAFYSTMLRDAYSAIKVADPRMVVISAGLAPEPNNGTDIAPITFTQAMYQHGAKGYFDAFGDHPYSYPATPSEYEPWSGWSQMAATNPSIRSIMTANGDAATPVWTTEVGAPTNGPGVAITCGATTFPKPPFYDSQCVQAENISQVVQAEAANQWMGPAFIYSYEDLSNDTSDLHNFFGIREFDGTPKQSYSTLQQAIATSALK